MEGHPSPARQGMPYNTTHQTGTVLFLVPCCVSDELGLFQKVQGQVVDEGWMWDFL